ncbi:MAG: hypothetical protein K8S15_10905 [Candidatus Aegiribacteria sp.]|nr:hypothetical protein [Candidatus Aegiribacteria sp.]
MQKTSGGAGNGFFGIIAVGIILVLMGVPFVGMTIMSVMMVARNSKFGLPMALATLFVVFLISDFSGALIAATGSGIIVTFVRSGRSFRFSLTVAAAATALACIFGTLLLLQKSMLSSENVQVLMQFYGSAGMSSSEILFVMDLLLYILPALLALWAVAGVITSAVAARLVSRRRGVWPDLPREDSLRLGLLPAWILIAALAVNLTGSSFPPYLQQAAVNISIFMILPYSAVGLAVCRKVLSIYPQSFILAILVGIIFPPIAVGLLMIAGILDTWFDFRTRLNRMDERKNS